jgi:hypothetical protein
MKPAIYMTKLLKTGLTTTIIGLFLASSAPIATAQQNNIPCPLQPQTGRTLVLFGTTNQLLATGSLAEATSSPISVSLPAGIYNITASSFDAHSTRQVFQNQQQEQFYLRLSNGQTTNRISDLPETSDSLTEQIDANFAVTSNITSLIAQHAEYPDPVEPNSIIPVCVAFDDVTPAPTLSPSPTPAPIISGGSGDEADCCPGPDPEPEPKIAGIQTGTSPISTQTPAPAIAGVLKNFPVTGFPLKVTTALVVLLFASLIIWPAASQKSGA